MKKNNSWDKKLVHLTDEEWDALERIAKRYDKQRLKRQCLRLASIIKSGGLKDESKKHI